VLAGRDGLLREWELMLNDVAARGRVRALDMILSGPRGVGKTATVSAFAELAATWGFEVVSLQAVAGELGLVAGLLQVARDRVAANAGAWQRARAAIERLSGVSLSVAGFGASISTRPGEVANVPSMSAMSLAGALAALAYEARSDNPKGGLLVTIDELQNATGPDLALFSAALHRLNVEHPTAPVAFAGTGLPTTYEALRKAGVTHADRLFDLQPLPPTLEADEARYAVVEPAMKLGVMWDPAAADALVEVANGYPAHLQLLAQATWRAAIGPTEITLDDFYTALPRATATLEQRSFGPRWSRMSDRQMEFLAAMALSGGRATTPMITRTLGRSAQELSWLRDQLIDEGDIYSPRRGELVMAVPLFNDYVLSHYEQARSSMTADVLSLEQMTENARASKEEQA
jgi:hypothetical protein